MRLQAAIEAQLLPFVCAESTAGELATGLSQISTIAVKVCHTMRQDLYGDNIKILNLSGQAFNVLGRANVTKISQILAMSDAELLHIQRMGRWRRGRNDGEGGERGSE